MPGIESILPKKGAHTHKIDPSQKKIKKWVSDLHASAELWLRGYIRYMHGCNSWNQAVSLHLLSNGNYTSKGFEGGKKEGLETCAI